MARCQLNNSLTATSVLRASQLQLHTCEDVLGSELSLGSRQGSQKAPQKDSAEADGEGLLII